MGDVLPRRPAVTLRRLLALPFWPVRRLLWPQFAWVRATVVEVDVNAATRAATLERQLAGVERSLAEVERSLNLQLSDVESAVASMNDRLADVETATVESMSLAGEELRSTGDALAALAQTQTTGGAPRVAAYAGRAFASLSGGERILMGAGVSSDVADALAALGLRPVSDGATDCAGAITVVSEFGPPNGADPGALEGIERLSEAVRPGGTLVVIVADTTPAAVARALAGWDVADLVSAGDSAPVFVILRVTGEVARA